ncbi:hypothetical protein AC578_6858 [Pseudocercospora eumusae]|uniref:Uncharacterized protein n=1 Tax=Pseudocercospora eumusae TaxID=321146 RepID=A0A139H7D2_9PEZI|nr:hypothetical protein AC578_6858 [Pseudocercospora eumusae]
MNSDLAADISSHKTAQEDTMGGSARATPLEGNSQAKCIAAKTSGAVEEDFEKVEVENIRGDGVLPKASDVESTAANSTEAITDDRIQNLTNAGEQEGGSASGDGAQSTSAIAEITSTAEGDTEKMAAEADKAEPAEAKENVMSDEEAKEIARKAAYRRWIQDQIDLTEADVKQQRKEIEELEEARAMMEKNFREEIAAIEVKQKKLLEKLSKGFEKFEEANE